MKPNDILSLSEHVKMLKKLRFKTDIYVTPARIRSDHAMLRVKPGDVLTIVSAFPDLPIEVTSWKISGLKWLKLLAVLADRGLSIQVGIFLRIKSESGQKMVFNYSKNPSEIESLIARIQSVHKK